jgi:hypothetical protein
MFIGYQLLFYSRNRLTAHTGSIDLSRSTLVGIGLSCLVAVAMLAWPLFGEPPYGFYAPMKWVVAFASGAGAWAVWQFSRAWLPLSVLLVASGGVEFFGKMRRDEWVPFNWASIVLLTVAGLLLLSRSRKARAMEADAEPG